MRKSSFRLSNGGMSARASAMLSLQLSGSQTRWLYRYAVLSASSAGLLHGEVLLGCPVSRKGRGSLWLKGFDREVTNPARCQLPVTVLNVPL
jgi:hypothetical protein